MAVCPLHHQREQHAVDQLAKLSERGHVELGRLARRRVRMRAGGGRDLGRGRDDAAVEEAAQQVGGRVVRAERGGRAPRCREEGRE